MNIWWCEEHENAGDDLHCKDAMFNSNFGPEDGECRMVEMRLIRRVDPGLPRCPRCHGSGIDERAAVLDLA